MTQFELDERLQNDSLSLLHLTLCDLRLAKDGRWPWLILVPQRAGVSELFDLTPADQTVLMAEQMRVAEALKKATCATKINIAAIGNVVRQLHIHIVARFEGDANWPGPIWGYGTAEPYDTDSLNVMKNKILDALT